MNSCKLVFIRGFNVGFDLFFHRSGFASAGMRLFSSMEARDAVEAWDAAWVLLRVSA